MNNSLNNPYFWFTISGLNQTQDGKKISKQK